MIKVGEVYQDKTTNKHYEVLNFFAGQIKISDGKNQYYISEEHFNLIFESPDYKKMYEQQKQRADRAEKRWEKIKEHFIKEKEQSFGILSWSRNNGMLELIEKLEEDGE